MNKARPLFTSITLAAALGIAFGAPAAGAPQVEAPEHGHDHWSHHPPAGYLGLLVRPLNSDLRRHFGAPSERGVLVASVEDDSPAAAAGLAVGDVIVGIDGEPVGSVAALHRAVRRRGGDTVEVEIFRDGERRALRTTLGTRESGHRHWDGEEWEEHWREWGEGWAEWGEEWGEGWAEWGEEFGEQWAEFGAEMGERWGERGAEWAEIGAEIGARMAEAFAEMDWSEMDRALEKSMRALQQIDWDEIGDEIDAALEEVDEALDEALDKIEEDDGDR